MPNMQWLQLGGQGRYPGLINPGLGNLGVLGPVLRRLPKLDHLYLHDDNIGDEGVASLIGDIGEKDWPSLEFLWLSNNKITDAGMAALLAAIEAGAFPKMSDHANDEEPWRIASFVEQNHASEALEIAVLDAVAKRHGNRVFSASRWWRRKSYDENGLYLPFLWPVR